jgi:hypothetical protein
MGEDAAVDDDPTEGDTATDEEGPARDEAIVGKDTAELELWGPRISLPPITPEFRLGSPASAFK